MKMKSCMILQVFIWILFLQNHSCQTKGVKLSFPWFVLFVQWQIDVIFQFNKLIYLVRLVTLDWFGFVIYKVQFNFFGFLVQSNWLWRDIMHWIGCPSWIELMLCSPCASLLLLFCDVFAWFGALHMLVIRD